MQTIDEILTKHPEYITVKNRLLAANEIAKSVIQDASETATLAVFEQLRDASYSQSDSDFIEHEGVLH